jgi:hypothetical protein
METDDFKIYGYDYCWQDEGMMHLDLQNLWLIVYFSTCQVAVNHRMYVYTKD